MINGKEHLHHSLFPASGGPPDYVWPGNVESALLDNIVQQSGQYCRTNGLSKFRRKSQAFKLNFPLARTLQPLPQSGKEEGLILVEPNPLRALVAGREH